MSPDMTEEKRTKRRKKNLELIQKLRLMDNPFMARVFQGDVEIGQLSATLMTGRDDITVTSVITEHELKNLRMKRGVTIMSDLFEKYLQEEHAEGKAECKAEGIAITTLKFIRNQLKRHVPYQQIAEDTETPLDEVIRIAKESHLAY